jgi:uncharacterized Ntn-hydrolase superfamily protein
MTQESADGIPLRFKGIALFRIKDPVEAATAFDFSSTEGVEQIEEMIAHICLGELRALVSSMSMAECIEQRKDRLSTEVESALRAVAAGESGGWGIEIETVQIAQVFIVDQTIRDQLERERRNAIRRKAEESQIETDERLETSRIESRRRLEEHELDAERDARHVAEEKLYLESSLKAKTIETAAPIRMLELEKRRAEIEEEIDVRTLENKLLRLRVEGDMIAPEAEQRLEREILPMRQAPEIARALGGLYQGAHLTVVGEDGELVRAIAPVIELLAQAMRGETLGGE